MTASAPVSQASVQSRRVLRGNRDFTLLWSAAAASTLGSQMSAIALPLLVLGITGSPSSAGGVAFVGLLTLWLARLPAGALADRVSRRKVMVICDLGRAAVVASIAVAVLTGSLTLIHLYIASVTAMLLSAAFYPAASGALPRVVPTEQISLAMTRGQLRDQTAALVGPPLGGVAFTIARALPFAVDAISYVASALGVSLIRSDLSVAARPRTGLLRDIREGGAWLLRQRKLMSLLLWSAAANFTMNGIVLGVVLVARQGGASASLIGVMDALGGVGGVLGALVASRIVERVTARQALGVTGATWAALFATMSLTASPYLLGILLLLTIAVSPTTGIIVNTALVVDTPDEMRARVSSTAGVIASSANPLGPLVMGILLARIGGSAMLLFAAVVAVGTITFLVRSVGIFDVQPPGKHVGTERGADDDGVDDTRAGSTGERPRRVAPTVGERSSR